MQKNTDTNAQRKRRRDAWLSAVTATVWLVLSACLLLYLQQRYLPDGIWSAVMRIISVLELGMIIPVWILLKARLKEIEGGEEDDASQY